MTLARRLAVSAVVTLTAAACLLEVGVSQAPAMVTHNYLGSFGSFPNVQGLAVDDSTGDVYVYDNSTESIYKYTESGEPAEFTATKTNVITGVGTARGPSLQQVAVDNSSGPAKGNIYLANATNVNIYAPDGSFLGELNSDVEAEVEAARGTWSSPEGVEPSGVAVDALGNVYVGLFFHVEEGKSFLSHVDKYVPQSSAVKNTDYAATMSGLQVIRNIAVDSEGSVYTQRVVGTSKLMKFDALQFGALQASGTEVAELGDTMAVDLSTNELYVDAESEILIYDSLGTLIERINPQSETPSQFTQSNGLAVNSSNHHVYVSDNEHGRVNAFGPAVVIPDVATGTSTATTATVTVTGVVNPSGVEASCKFEYGTGVGYGQTAPCSSAPGSGTSPVDVSAEIGGLTPGTHYHFRLVATNENGSNAGEDGTFALAFPPDVGSEWSTDVAVSTANVEAVISPMGFDSTFHVEYGTDISYGSSVPIPDAPLGSEGSEMSHRQPLTGLLSGTTYHFRIAATNVNGTTFGPDRMFTTLPEPAGEGADGCPNAAFRLGAGARLPDCRAYEMVSPADKNGANVNGQMYKEFTSSLSGERVQFATLTGLGDTQGSGTGGYTQYIASRTSSGWVTNSIIPTPALNTPVQFGGVGTKAIGFSDELDRAVVTGYVLPGVGGAIPDRENLYLETTLPPKVLEAITRFEQSEETVDLHALPDRISGASSDIGVITFQTEVNLVPPTTGAATKLYVLDHGSLLLGGVMPDGSAPEGGSMEVRQSQNGEAMAYKDTVSKDGSRFFFLSPASGPNPQLYMRRNESTTVPISQSEGTIPVAEPGQVYFQAATPDGTKVLFSTTDRLTDSDPGGGGTALYMYTDGPNPEGEANLTYIARSTGLENSGQLVMGISDDGSHVYFASDSGISLWDNGDIQQVAPNTPSQVKREARVTPDGREIAFMYNGAETSQEVESLPTTGNTQNTEIYLYDQDANTLKCVSCPQTGARAMLGVEVTVKATSESPVGFNVPEQPRFLSNNGRYVFFSTREALVAQDSNKLTDAYEYDGQTGRVSLLSSGTGDRGTWFVDASPDGRDAFLLTSQELTRGDEDKLVDLYDARIEGGFSEPPLPGTPCAGDACQGTPSASPSFNTASEFSGLGNPLAAPPAKVKSKSLGRSEKLRRALKACAHKPKHRRATCRARARKRYGAESFARSGAKRSARSSSINAGR